MIVTDLNGNKTNWKLVGHQVSPSNDRNVRSALHLQARKLLHDIFSPCIILEEVCIPIKKGSSLFLDYYIPLRKIAIECQGIQHFIYNSHFYNTMNEFKKAQQRDADKKEWCERNGIEFIPLIYNETIDEWKQKLT